MMRLRRENNWLAFFLVLAMMLALIGCTPESPPADPPSVTPTEVVVGVTDAPTPVPTNTPTDVPATDTPTPTEKATPSTTPADEVTPTEELVVTDTPTPDPTATDTPVPTNTPTKEPTKVPDTMTPTNKPTNTPVPTNTPTKEPTKAATPTPVPATSTPTPTNAPTNTPTQIPTPTAVAERGIVSEERVSLTMYFANSGGGTYTCNDSIFFYDEKGDFSHHDKEWVLDYRTPLKAVRKLTVREYDGWTHDVYEVELDGGCAYLESFMLSSEHTWWDEPRERKDLEEILMAKVNAYRESMGIPKFESPFVYYDEFEPNAGANMTAEGLSVAKEQCLKQDARHNGRQIGTGWYGSAIREKQGGLTNEQLCEKLFQQWKNSPGHNANMLDNNIEDGYRIVVAIMTVVEYYDGYSYGYCAILTYNWPIVSK